MLLVACCATEHGLAGWPANAGIPNGPTSMVTIKNRLTHLRKVFTSFTQELMMMPMDYFPNVPP